MEFIVAGLIGLAVTLAAWAILDTTFSEARRVERRLEAIGAFTPDAISEAEPLAAPFRQRVVIPVMQTVNAKIRSVAPNDYYKRLGQKIASAGLANSTTPDKMVMLKIVSAIAGGVAAPMLARTYDQTMPIVILAGIAGFAGFSYAPDLYLNNLATKRRDQIVMDLPDMLDMLTISVQAGLGFDQAVTRYVAYSEGPLPYEFNVALGEMRAGKTRREALRTMADRAGVAELRAFVMAIVQADIFGVSISDVLRVQSHELRSKRRARAEELAQAAPGKMAFPTMGCILPATVLTVLAPAVVGIMEIFAT